MPAALELAPDNSCSSTLSGENLNITEEAEAKADARVLSVARLVWDRSPSSVIFPWLMVRRCLRRREVRERWKVLAGSICSAEIAKPGSMMASGCRRDVVNEANESGKPVS